MRSLSHSLIDQSCSPSNVDFFYVDIPGQSFIMATATKLSNTLNAAEDHTTTLLWALEQGDRHP